ncbi:hypothetical protein [Vibrio coralliilyticus]|nr:hypothetical protein [Vibrio coralliilyticus]
MNRASQASFGEIQQHGKHPDEQQQFIEAFTGAYAKHTADAKTAECPE